MTDRPREEGEGSRRVHGAWSTPAVVVRRPDGSIVSSGPQPGDGAGPGPREPDGGGPDAAGPAGARRTRPRPRRIPGAPGSVLLAPTLSDLGADPAGRRLRRNSGTPATVTPLPPRPRPQSPGSPDSSGSTDDAGPSVVDGSGAVDGAGTMTPSPPRPSLRVVGEVLRRRAQPSAERRTATTFAAGPPPTRSRPRRPRRARRARRAVAGLRTLDLPRILPSDPEERAERIARWRRVGVRAAAVVVAGMLVYTVFPVRTALDLRAAEVRARERKAAFEREIPILEDEKRDLGTDGRVEEEARELGLVYPGEESYGIYPAPEGTDPAPTTTTTTTVPGG